MEGKQEPRTFRCSYCQVKSLKESAARKHMRDFHLELLVWQPGGYRLPDPIPLKITASISR